VNDRLDQLRIALAAAPDLEVLPPASLAAVAAFEARRGIVLPEAYRRFVLEVADGLRLDGEAQLYSLTEVDTATGDADAARPFAYDAAETAAIEAAIAVAGAAGRSVLEDRAVMGLQKAGDPDGCLTLAGNGGNDFSALVVTGDQRGRMWRTGELDAPETRALYAPGGDTAPLDFLDWLIPWASCFLGVELGE